MEVGKACRFITGLQGRMRILLYKDNLSTGRGADRAVTALAMSLAKRHTVVVATKSEFKVAMDSMVQVVMFSELKDLKIAINDIHPDIIVSAGTNETLDLASIHPESFPCPVVHQFHIYPPTAFKWKRFIRNWKMRRAIRRCAVVQVLLPSYVSPVRKWFGDNRRIAVIGNAVNVDNTLNANLRNEPPVDIADVHTRRPYEELEGCLGLHPHIVYPAAINRDKRQELLIKAFAQMDNRDAVLSLYGDGKPKYIAQLKRLAAKLGVAERIRFAGYCDNTTSIYADADIVAFPSRTEGFPLVIMESATFGRRVVGCSDCLASAELVPHFGGIMSAPTPKALAIALDSGLTPTTTENASNAKVQNALNAFSSDNICHEWECLFASLASDRSSGAGKRSVS